MVLRNIVTFGVSAVAGGLLLAGCGGSSGGGDGDGTGTLSFGITDAPVDNVTRVKVTFDRIDLQPVDGDRIEIVLDEPKVIENLLELQGTNAAELLGDTTVDAGEYEWVRLFIIGGADDSLVDENGGGTFDLFIPGQQNSPDQAQGNRRFLQLSGPLTVPAGGSADFTIDVELRKALVKPANDQGYYFLRPALRLVDNTEVGTIVGEVAPELTMAGNCGDANMGNAVYLYEGADAEPGDVNLTATNGEGGDDPQPDHDSDDSDGNTTEVNPVTAAEVSQQDEDSMLEYTIGFVAAGDYTVAFTCEAENDTSENDEAIVFEQPQTVSVEAEQESQVNFTAASAE